MISPRNPYGRRTQWWKRRRVVLSAILVLAIVVSSLLWWAYPNLSDDNRDTPAGTTLPAAESTGEPRSLPTETNTGNTANKTALAILDGFPAHFKCRQYPERDTVVPADLIPTANVLIVLAYNEARGVYDVQADPRATVNSKESTETGDDGKTFTQVTYSWRYPDGSRLYNVYGNMKMSSTTKPWVWSGVAMSVDAVTDTFNIRLAPSTGKLYPKVVIAASDPTTCAHGSVAFPQDFAWTDPAQNGLLKPVA